MRECQAARYEGEKQFPSAAQPVSVTTDLSLVTWCRVLTSNDRTWNGNENQKALTHHKSHIKCFPLALPHRYCSCPHLALSLGLF